MLPWDPGPRKKQIYGINSSTIHWELGKSQKHNSWDKLGNHTAGEGKATLSSSGIWVFLTFIVGANPENEENEKLQLSLETKVRRRCRNQASPQTTWNKISKVYYGFYFCPVRPNTSWWPALLLAFISVRYPPTLFHRGISSVAEEVEQVRL